MPEKHKYTETAIEIQTMKLKRLLEKAQKNGKPKNIT